MMSTGERTLASLTAAVVLVLGLFALSRIPMLSPRAEALNTCEHELEMRAEDFQICVEYLVTRAQATGDVPPVALEELTRATGIDVPEAALPCLRAKARQQLGSSVS